MNILLLGAKRAPDSMEEHVFDELLAMGHEVSYFDNRTLVEANAKADLVCRFLIGNVLREPERLKERKLLEVASSRVFDIVIVILGNHFSPKTVDKLKQLVSCPIICWTQDALSTLGRQYIIGAKYDRVFLKDRYLVDLFSRYTDKKRFLFLPEACAPLVHRPIARELIEDEFKADITTAASLYYYRHEIFKTLADYDLKIWGSKPSWLVSELDSVFMGRQVRLDDKRKAFNGAKIVVNSLHLAEISGVNVRAFEVAGCGGFQLITYNNSIHEYFEIGKEIETFKDLDELRTKVKYFLENDDERESIAKEGSRAAHERHNYGKRLSEMLEAVL